MKTNKSSICSCSTLMRITTIFSLIWMSVSPAAHSQGTLTFDPPKPNDNYYEQGFWFRISPGAPPPEFVHMSGLSHIAFAPTINGYYVSLSLTDGGTFGLSSVDLYGTYYDGTTVQFNGYFGDGSMVSSTFSVPYDLQWNTYQFGSQFSSGLVRVDIPTSPWAMDNLAYVPEPSAFSLVGLGVLALAAGRFHRRQKV